MEEIKNWINCQVLCGVKEQCLNTWNFGTKNTGK